MRGNSSSKLMSLAEAARLVRAGDVIGIGGMTLHRKPMAFVRELVRLQQSEFTLVSFTSSFEAELLAAACALKAIRACYMGLEYLGLAPQLRRATEAGAVQVIEETEYSIVMGLQAQLMRVPYLPSRDCELGTDYFKIRADLKRALCPGTGDALTWFPAIAPRVSIIHAPMADVKGNVWLGGDHCIDQQLAMAADITIVTVERVVGTDEIRAAQAGAGLLSFMVDAVVEAPGGAHPTSCFPDYPVDVVHLTRYLRQVRQHGARAYLDRYVTNCPSLPAYLDRVCESQYAAN